jgi:phospholipid/cholesterol/gamma-HCH transport system substrate-binding protein
VSARENTRVVALGALALGVIALAFLLLMSGGSYTIHAHFHDAGGLVGGGQVEVGGVPVGSISNISVTSNGQADVELSIDRTGLTPLHEGTRASIRAVGQAGVTENFVELSPGPLSGPALSDGAVLPTTQTSGIVPIDALLDSFGPSQRAHLGALISNSAQVYAGSGSRYFNQMLGKLDPALGALDGFTSSLALDRGALGELVRTGAAAATAVASRGSDLTAAVTHTAIALGAVASQRQNLADLLSRMPAVLDQARGTLARTGDALTTLRPALRDVLPVASPLHDFLTRLDSVLPAAGPVVAQLRAQLPALNQSLAGLEPLAGPAVEALDTLGPAMQKLFPIAHGARFYGTDLVLGALNIIGLVSPDYSALGHYAKANFVQSPQTLVAGPLAAALAGHPLVPGLLAVRTGLTRRCPGGNQPPAPDGSSPWNLGPTLCTAAQDQPPSVNFP